MKVVKHIVALWSVIVAVLLVSCAKETAETLPGPYTGERLQMKIRLGDVSAAADDATVTTVRAIVFNDKGNLVYNDVQEAVLSGDVYSASIQAAPGINDFYLVCNETEALGTKLAAVNREADIEAATFSAAGVHPPLPMFGKVTRAFVSANSDGSDARITVDNVTSDQLSVKVNRMVARLSFTAIKNIPAGETDFAVTALRVRVCRMPAATSIGENKVYTSDAWADDLTVAGEGTLDNNGAFTKTSTGSGTQYTIPDGVDKVVVPDIYIPEHLLEVPADASQATYLKIDAQCRLKDGTAQTVSSIYLLNLGEAPPQNHNLRRNNHYQIYATITGLGAMGLYAEIVAMEQHDITVNWKPIEGMVIVSDKAGDYDFAADTTRNVNVWNDYTVYSGILKTYHAETGYKDVVFRYGSVIAVANDRHGSDGQAFVAPSDASTLNDILWFPASYGNPYGKITDWGGIPYISTGDIPVDNSRVTDGLGDPCKLVGLSETQIRDEGIVDNRQWHMATPEEYAILMAAADNETSAGYNDLGYRSFHTLLQPYAPYRNENGQLAAVGGSAGWYWTTTGLSAFGFSGSDPATAAVTAQNPQRGYTVRCVRNDIPESYMMIERSPTFTYQGNTTTGLPIRVAANVPFGRATLITSGPNVGTSTDFDDFSFEPGGTHVHTVTGAYSQDVPVYVKRKESQIQRTFKVMVEGMGFDGRTVSQIVTVKQNGYSFNGTIADISDEKIPKAGKTYNLTVTLTPNDIAVPAGRLVVEAKYLDNPVGKTAEIATSPDKYVYENMEITIAPNNTPDVIGISFKVYYLTESGAKSSISYEKIILQDNK